MTIDLIKGVKYNLTVTLDDDGAEVLYYNISDRRKDIFNCGEFPHLGEILKIYSVLEPTAK